MTLLLVHVQVFGQSVPSYVPTNGLVGWWGFNGNAQDGSGNGNHGTIFGPTLSSDRFGNLNSAFHFSQGSYINVGSSILGTSPASLTYSVWVDGTGALITKRQDPFVSWATLMSNHFSADADSYHVMSCLFNSSPYWSTSWNHVVAVKDNSNFSVFINGNFLCWFNSGYHLESPDSLLFGLHTAWGSGFNGKLDDIGIWNRALSQQEITNLFQPCQASLTTQPSNQTTGANRNVQFSVVSSDSNSTYRWQSNSGFGYQDLYNAGQYSGVTTSNLNVFNTSNNNNNQLFRCIVSISGCRSDTSDVATLNVNSSSTSTGVPNKFTYQSVVRDTMGHLVTNQQVGMRLSLQRGPHLANLYTETHQLTTNSNGLLTCIIGSGQPTLGMMDTIDWSGGMVYVKTEIDMTGGSNYSLVSTRELLSVPYALYSLNSGSSTLGPVGPMGPQGPAGNDGAVGPQGPQGVQGPSGASFPAGGTSGQALYYCNGVPTWGPCPNQPTMPTVTTNPVTLLPGNSASTGGNVTSDGGSPVTHRGVVYDTTSNPSLTSNYTVDGSGTGSFVSTLNNLAPTTTYYTRAYATNAVGTAYGSVVSFSTTLSLPTVSLGLNHAGGIVFYIDQTGQHGLVCAPFDQGIAPWGLYGVDVQGTSTAIGTGAQNTAIIMAYNNSGWGALNTASPAIMCDTLTLNGYSDWYLPSLDELNRLYFVLHLNGLGNFNGSGALYSGYYWSSSQMNWHQSYNMRFNDGNAGNMNFRFYDGNVRAIRSF